MKNKMTLCRKIALGSLTQGYFHNLRGTLQALSLQLQLLIVDKNVALNPQISQRVNKAISILQKLQNQLDTAFEVISQEKKGFLNLKNFLEKEILFWEADLDFKHKIKKEIIVKKDVYLETSYELLKGIFCIIFQELIHGLKEETVLKIYIDDNLKFTWDKAIEEDALKRLKNIAESLKDYIKLEVNPDNLQLCLKNFCG